MLHERIIELERRLGLDSNNSSKPPPRDGLKKQTSRTQSLPEKSGKKSGGQPGHKGVTLKQVENPNIIEHHKIERCPHCECNLDQFPVTGICARQIFDVPLTQKPIVTEHQLDIKRCPNCHKKVMAQSNGIAAAPVQYGSNIKALVTYLHIHNLIPVDRITQIVYDFYGLQISEATVLAIIETCAANVSPMVEKIEKQLKSAPVKGADESSLPVAGKTSWLHTLCNDYLFTIASQKSAAMCPTILLAP